LRDAAVRQIREIARLSANERVARFENSSISPRPLRSRAPHRLGKLTDHIALEIAATS
jgi:hypothetical protein